MEHSDPHYDGDVPPPQDYNHAYHHHHHPPLSQHYRREFVAEPQFYRHHDELDGLSRVLVLFKTNGFLLAFAVAIGVILMTHYKGTLE